MRVFVCEQIAVDAVESGQAGTKTKKTVGREIEREKTMIRSKPRILAANWVGWLSLITAVDS